MSTIEELERLEREIAVAEHRALDKLATHLREAAVELPIQSRLALLFAQHARRVDDHRITAFSALSGLLWDIEHGEA